MSGQGFEFGQLPPPQPLRVGYNPDVHSKYCDYNPNTYKVEAFVAGAFRYVYMGVITNLKNEKSYPFLEPFLQDGSIEDRLRQADKHLEYGRFFVERYRDITRSGQSLAPLSGHHINVISETDRTPEKLQVCVGYNREDYVVYFCDYASFSQFMDAIKGNMTNAVKESLASTVRGMLCADPSNIYFDDRELARIFGSTWDNRPATGQGRGLNLMVPDEEVGRAYNELMKGLITKYVGKAKALWKNICHYNPYNFAFDVKFYEEMRKPFIYNVGDKDAIIPAEKDRLKIQLQQTYTDSHKVGEEDSSGSKTRRIIDLHRNDCLFALFYTIKQALRVITTERSSEFWLGEDTMQKIYDDKESWTRWQQTMAQLASQELTGFPIQPGHSPDENLAKNYAENTRRSNAYGFEVMSTPENLVLFLNPEDYDDLDTGIARRGPADVRAVNLEMLKKYCSNIYPLRGMKPGFARLIDKRALTIRNYFQMTHTATPAEYDTWRHKLIVYLTFTVFSLFAGTLFVPTPHFVASPRFYDKYGLIGQPIVQEQDARS